MKCDFDCMYITFVIQNPDVFKHILAQNAWPDIQSFYFRMNNSLTRALLVFLWILLHLSEILQETGRHTTDLFNRKKINWVTQPLWPWCTWEHYKPLSDVQQCRCLVHKLIPHIFVRFTSQFPFSLTSQAEVSLRVHTSHYGVIYY